MNSSFRRMPEILNATPNSLNIMIKKLLFMGSAMAIFGATTVSDAAIMVSLTDSLPAPDHVLATLNPDTIPEGAGVFSYPWRHNNGTASNNLDVALAFRAGASGTLDELGVYIEGGHGGGGGNAFTILIRESDTAPTGNNGNYTGTLLLNKASIIDVGAQSGNILKFAFTDDDVVSLTEGKYYSVTLVWSLGVNSAKSFRLQFSDSPISDGEVVGAHSWHKAATTSTWSYNDSRDFLFYAGSVEAIPEPSTVALLGLSAAGLVWMRRRRVAGK